MQWPGQQLTNHCKSRLSGGWEPLSWAGAGQGQAVGRKQAGPGGLGSLGERPDQVSAPLRTLLQSVKPRYMRYLKAPNAAIPIC